MSASSLPLAFHRSWKLCYPDLSYPWTLHLFIYRFSSRIRLYRLTDLEPTLSWVYCAGSDPYRLVGKFQVSGGLGCRSLKGPSHLKKKSMNWHTRKSDVPWFRKIKNECLPNFTRKYSLVFKIYYTGYIFKFLRLLLLFTFWDICCPYDVVWKQ